MTSYEARVKGPVGSQGFAVRYVSLLRKLSRIM
jgi:hypothetical protein